MTSRGKNPQPDSPEAQEVIDNELQNILGQNYVDEYSGSDRHIGTDEIAAQLAAKLDEYYTNKFLEARTDNFVSKLHEYPITDQQIILGGIIYKYFMQETNGTKITMKLKNFSVKGNVLGDLEIRAELRQAIKQLSKRGE